MSTHPLRQAALACAVIVAGALYLTAVARALAAIGDVMPVGLRHAAGTALGLGVLAVLALCMGRPR